MKKSFATACGGLLIVALGLVGAGMRQRTDTAHVLGRVRDLNRLELAGETVRAALEALAAAAPGWLAGVIDASWQEVYGQRIDAFRLPEAKARRADLAVRYGRDGYHLLRQVHDLGAPGWLRRPARGAGAAPGLDPAAAVAVTGRYPHPRVTSPHIHLICAAQVIITRQAPAAQNWAVLRVVPSALRRACS